MKSKLFILLLLLILAFPATFSTDVSRQYAAQSNAYPFLALIEVNHAEGVSTYFNGVYASLTWVMTVSSGLAQEPTGKPRNQSIIVHGDLGSFDKIASAPKRNVKKIVTDLMGPEDNKYFPNLVLLQLESAFPRSETLKPAVFNTGKLSVNSLMVGWGWDLRTRTILTYPMDFPVNSLSTEQCAQYNVVEFIEQFCGLSTKPMTDTFQLLDGALLVDQNRYITGLMQYTSYLHAGPATMPILILVRLSYFQTFWQFHVLGVDEIFLDTDFKDDIIIEPWNAKEEEGIGLEYTQGGCVKIKEIDLSELTSSTDIEELAFKVAKGEPLITPNIHHQLVGSLSRLQEKIFSNTVHKFYRHKTLKTHLLPITNVAFDKFGKKCLTGSYDRTCKVWDIETGEEIHTLQGHKNVVYAVTFNNQGDKVLTGSFDKTALLWSVESGECKQSFSGHSGEVVAVQFDPQKQLIATASMDTTARLYNLSTGQEVSVLQGHSGEIISLQYNNSGGLLLTGSFDSTLGLWDTRTNSKLGTLSGHEAEVSSCLFSQDENLVVSGSLDKSARIWDVRMLSCIHCTDGHQDEVLDVAVDLRSRQLATASSDSTVYLWDMKQACNLVTILSGHSQEVSKVCFNPAGTAVLTASQDHTARLWDPVSGQCLQVLEGHSDDVFSCAFSYYGDTIVTASKDNTCRIWQNTVNK